jgi:3-dehydroquinate synthase
MGERSYPVYVGPRVLEGLGALVEASIPDATGCVVVTSDAVGRLYGVAATESLQGLRPSVVTVPDGEGAKTWDQAGALLRGFAQAGLDRKGVVVALGGGTVGDLAGFAASIYLRGVRVVQVPTTLLGQADSCVGGKTAVNLPEAKNLVGSFHQPAMVAADTGLLSSLPRREVASGLAEVVKHGVIADEALLGLVEERSRELLGGEEGTLTEAVTCSLAVKASFVEADERETRGVRVCLNYGHTVGHAVERLSGGEVRHGEAVAMGMDVAAGLAVSRGVLTEQALSRQRRVLNMVGLDTRMPGMDAGELLKVARRDKKAQGGRIRLILPTGIGLTPILEEVPEAELMRAMEDNMG